MFLKSIDASSYVKDANLIYSLLADVVEEVGVKIVVEVIRNNATNYWQMENCYVHNSLLFFGSHVLPIA
jgi:hypothetical protein